MDFNVNMRYVMEYKTEALKWLESEIVDKDTKDEIKRLKDNELEDSFYRTLEFGTGGLRGIMGAGTNRMNIYTVRRATQGLADEILSLGEKAAEKGVVIAYDSRKNSKEFAMECAKVLCANNIKAYIFDSLRPTPELSFAVRYLGCVRGIVITASHNPKEYNGYKVYGEDGGQITPKSAKIIQKYIDNVDIFKDVCVCENANAEVLGDKIDDAYIENVKACAFKTDIPENFKIVYTPLHGAGNLSVRRILKEVGIKNVTVVAEQELPDGNFPTVISPNPEDKEALKIAIGYAKKVQADLVLGTDPDSDRVGIAIPDSNGEYKLLTGNQTGVLLCEYILKHSELTEESTVIKTIVTTEMISAVCRYYNVKLVNVLTGFKYIGEQIKLLEEKNKESNFVFGLEESYGYLRGTYTRDKDAVVASMLIALMTAECKNDGIGLADKLTSLYEKYGYYAENMETITLPGISGGEKINEIMENLRNGALQDDFVKMEDYNHDGGALPKSNVLKLYTDSGDYVAVRPSGTEPKIKFYFGVCSDSYEKSMDKLQKLKNRVLSVITIGNSDMRE